MSYSFYLTTTLPYVNSDPHIGFALEIIQADAIARYQRLLGKEVFYNTGTDEHGLKIYRKAEERGISTQAYCDEYAAKFRDLATLLHLDHPTFIRTTDVHHKAAAQEFWRRCLANGDIYKKAYQVKYCVGCELEKTDSELVDGKCPIHPTYTIELIDEENYFFSFSKFQEPLLKLYEERPDFVVPAERFNEIKAFVARGLEDFSISRLKSKMPWGVPIPDDETQVMYVWFDALVNYISTLGWPESSESFERFWGTIETPNAIQVAGKDNLRQQSAMWQAMLLSAKLPTSKQIFIHGYITAEGQKMSKSIGNVVNPYDVVHKYGVDPVRHFILGGLPAYDDGDWSEARFRDWYNAELANGIGNLASRVHAMIGKYCNGIVPQEAEDAFTVSSFWSSYDEAIHTFRFDNAVQAINGLVKASDGYISLQKPWEKAKKGESVDAILATCAEALYHIGVALLPIIPETAKKLLAMYGVDSVQETLLREHGAIMPGKTLGVAAALFPRLEQKEG